MFENIKELLGNGADVQSDSAPTERDIHILVAFLLLETARSDGEQAPIEEREVARALSDNLSLDEAGVGDIIGVADFLVRDKANLDKFINIVAERFSVEQRQRIISMAWRIVFADQQVLSEEISQAGSLAWRLGLSEDEAKEAIQKAF